MLNQFLAIAIAFMIGLTGELVLSLPATRLSAREISQQLQTIPGWQLRDQRIKKLLNLTILSNRSLLLIA